MSARTVGLVARKELLEALRDRRTLFVALVLPVLLYPLMMLTIGPLVSLQKRRLTESTQPIAVTGAGADAVRRLVLEPRGGNGAARPPAGLAVTPSDDPARDLREGRIALWIEAGPDFEAAVAGGRSGRLVVHRDGSDDRSLAAWQKWQDALEAANDAELDRRGIDAERRHPIQAVAQDVAPPERRAAYVFGKLLAFVLVVLTLSSSFYPAVDAVAGEKERGTMETLLVAPCGRAELVLGKFVAVMAVTLTAAILNLVSMGLTLGPFVGAMSIEGLAVGLRLTPGVAAGILALLVPLAALFSATSLSLSTLARSVKEGQHYLTPLFLLVMPLAIVVILPNVPLSPLLAAVPVTNAVLFFRDLMLDRVEAATGLLVFAVTFGCAALALWASVRLFLREETLFRGPEGSGALLVRPAPRERPTAGAAVFLFAASLALVWYGQRELPTDVFGNVLATQLAVVLAPCLALAWWLRVDVRATFRLARPPLGTLALAVPLGLATPAVTAALQRWIGVELPTEGPFRAIAEQMERVVREEPAPLVLALFALLPAVCEELVYRGFLLSGFGASFGGRTAGARAVGATAAFFALFHLFPEKWAPTFLTGAVLGVLAWRSGSLRPAVLAHALHNASALYAERTPLAVLYDPSRSGHATAVAVAAVVLAACLACLCARRGIPLARPRGRA